jgi:hypothetical protein
MAAGIGPKTIRRIAAESSLCCPVISVAKKISENLCWSVVKKSCLSCLKTLFSLLFFYELITFRTNSDSTILPSPKIPKILNLCRHNNLQFPRPPKSPIFDTNVQVAGNYRGLFFCPCGSLKNRLESVSRIGILGFRICFEFRASDFEFDCLLVYGLCSAAKNAPNWAKTWSKNPI